MAFFMAFCSLSYEILIASRLSRICGEGMFYYPATLGVFILFMGLGSTRIYWQTKNAKPFSLQRLINVELLLSVIGAFSILGINLLLKDSLYNINLEAFALGFILAALIGYFSGQELPLLFNLCAALDLSQKEVRRIIFFDYLASFFASAVCTLIFFAHWGFFKTSLIIAFINVMIVVMLLRLGAKQNLPVSRHTQKFLFIFIAIFLVVLIQIDKLENRILQRLYLGDRNAVLLAKQYTPYQQILLFAMRKDSAPVTGPEEKILRQAQEYYLFAVLNGTLQFFEPFEGEADPDHTFLFDPYLKLLPPISHALILGGGDGLPARQAVRYPALQEITVVDIDQEWVDFARNNPFMKKKNRNAFADPRVHIYNEDAFQWIPRSQEKFGIIVVDFPSEPFTLAKLRTSSLQFYRDLKRVLAPEGVAVIHSNSFSSPVKLELITQTARKAGLYALYGYKPGSSRWSEVEQIILFQTGGARETFYKHYYNQYLTTPANQALINQWGHLDYAYLKRGEHWISFYDPLVSRLPWPKKLQYLME